MAKLWTAADKQNTASMPSWLLNSPFGDDGTIRQVLLANAKNNSLTTSVSSILGALAIIALINRIDRRRALIFSFAFLSLALLVLAIQTGLRVSELTALTCADVRLGVGAHVNWARAASSGSPR